MKKTNAGSFACRRSIVRRLVYNSAIVLALAPLLATAAAGPSSALSEDADRFYPRGLKATLGLGILSPSTVQDLDQGGSCVLRIGYGFDRITLWGSMLGSDHEGPRDAENRRRDRGQGGLELNVQYTIPSTSRWQPFGRLGIGAYAMEDRNTDDAWLGNGLSFSLGTDYVVSRHWGFGAEFTYRGLDYTRRRTGKKGDFKKLDDPIDGDATELLFSVTLR